MQITVDQIETLKDVPDSFFTPPPEAISLNSRPVIDGKSMPGFSLGHLVSSADPIYPGNAKQNRVTGEVILDAVITRDGHVREVKAITAPSPSLAISAIQAVLQWRFSPYSYEGQPIEVRTKVRVNYR